ncbi:diaminopimelate decarboxylase [Oceanisphaera pacifica]|uniref:Diaminopimelate decarboxylase n=1 Tax=Oceanisphaera pacifica TaxID=2818389 RepID=A0ABS3NIY8_9GAMM|nr:diaminopimelate decarboxylase [Oceanisphaera pacifica]MBO1520554.1 diaminopimelate decarboxylase [Oceanisphaera pacifica]
MDYFNYQEDGRLYGEACDLSRLAEQHGTPLYVYSRATLERHWHAFNSACGDIEHLVCYAVKANSNLAVLNVLARLGSGFDIVSKGELCRVLEAGGDAGKVVFSGVGKRVDEIEFALEHNIFCFNVESIAELARINEVAGRMGRKAPISIRVNPDIDAGTHPYISTGLKENKFGIPIEQAQDIYRQAAAMEHLDIHGLDCHIGSQLTEVAPFLEAVDKLLVLIDSLAADEIHIKHLDVGGGLGVRYDNETPPEPKDYVEQVKAKLAGRDLTLVLEPGRAIAANAGVLLTRVEHLKPNEDKSFAIVDAAMNDLIRPALYSAWQAIIPVDKTLERPSDVYDVVGPICETGDFIGKDRELAITEGDLLAVRSAGAYGFVMASNYNSRPRAAEVMVDGDQAFVVREREVLADLWHNESLLPAS